MNMNIEIPDDIAAALKAKARAQGVSADRFITDVLEKTLIPDLAQKSSQPFETGYGIWAKYGPAPSAEEIDENRREMFRNFANE
jgi:hypothetical protein